MDVSWLSNRIIITICILLFNNLQKYERTAIAAHCHSSWMADCNSNKNSIIYSEVKRYDLFSVLLRLLSWWITYWHDWRAQHAQIRSSSS